MTKNRPTLESLAGGQSPCIGVCTIDPYRRCVGCGRTLQQIGQWSTMTVAQRIEANRNLPKKVVQRLIDGASPPIIE